MSAETPLRHGSPRGVRLGLILLITPWLLHARAPESGAQTITSVSAPATLVINTAVAGSPPGSSTESGSVRVQTPGGKNVLYKVTASTSALPTGLTLTVSLSGIGTSLGTQTLGSTTVDLADGIGRNVDLTGTLTYTLTATTSAPLGSGSRSVTLSLVQY